MTYEKLLDAGRELATQRLGRGENTPPETDITPALLCSAILSTAESMDLGGTSVEQLLIAAIADIHNGYVAA